jgi:hypothetical protein
VASERLALTASWRAAQRCRPACCDLEDEYRFREGERAADGVRLCRLRRTAEWEACGRRGTLAGRPVNGRVAVRVGILAARSARQGARLPQLGLNIRPLRTGLLRTGGLNFLSAIACSVAELSGGSRPEAGS